MLGYGEVIFYRCTPSSLSHPIQSNTWTERCFESVTDPMHGLFLLSMLGATNGISSILQGGLDMTPSAFMYHSVAWVWLEYLTRGSVEAEHAMAECLAMVKVKLNSRKSDNSESTNNHQLRGSMRGECRVMGA